MAWIPAKTDWISDYSNGKYTGDHFTYEDYNRILNNVTELEVKAKEYKNDSTPIASLGNELTYTDWVYKEQWLKIINAINREAEYLLIDIRCRLLEENGYFYNARELNEIESLCEFLYYRFTNMIENKPHREHFVKHFGARGGL